MKTTQITKGFPVMKDVDTYKIFVPIFNDFVRVAKAAGLKFSELQVNAIRYKNGSTGFHFEVSVAAGISLKELNGTFSHFLARNPLASIDHVNVMPSNSKKVGAIIRTRHGIELQSLN